MIIEDYFLNSSQTLFFWKKKVHFPDNLKLNLQIHSGSYYSNSLETNFLDLATLLEAVF